MPVFILSLLIPTATMASEKKYPALIKRDEHGNESAALNTAVLLTIATEPAFRNKKYKEIAAEYIKRAQAEDPEFDKTFELDPKQGLFMGARLPETTTAEERQRIVDELKAKGYDAEIRMVGDIKK